MSLVTRCQVCATAFRVQRAQLAARGGKVRCGKCGAIFDGVAGLVDEGAAPLRLEPSPQLGLFDPTRRGQAAETQPAGESDVPEFLLEEPTNRRVAWLWTLAALAAAAALLAQVGYRYRAEIAVLAPATRGALEAACTVARCRVPLPRRPELMSIDASDLQTDARADNLIVLNALLRNRAPFPQEYPALELTLTDDAEKPVLRRVLLPSQYLDRVRSNAAAQGIPPGSEVVLRVNLDPGGVRATGYRLYLFFPQ
ncbi:MAG: zinc-ribbon and DUF3426 domain-containing protein [Betaproteobacteria bacterium]|nr:zinc-ribbon and DUF3426 domain-containing protein [Betaproteobacteria bacterium]